MSDATIEALGDILADAGTAVLAIYDELTAWLADNFRARIFLPLLDAAELRRIRIHDLRHTYASQMIAAGKELHFIQQQLGHHSPAFTLSVYGHLLPRDRRSEVDCLDDPKLSGMSRPQGVGIGNLAAG